MRRSVFSCLALATSILFWSSSAFAGSGELLNFQGLGDLQTVGGFYSGSGLASTPNYGITFSSNFFGLQSIYFSRPNGTTGSGNFAPLTIPGTGTVPNTTAIFMNGTMGSSVTGTMNVTNGFSNGINFFFTAGFQPGQTALVQIWSGLNGTGNLLATISLSGNDSGCKAPAYCNWSAVGAAFIGPAHSVTFTGAADELGLAQITLGSTTTAIPEPSSLFLVGTGLTVLSFKVRRFIGI
ncbi:MAG TPA: PEP-CTERM sorting domain-containing protein [Candidatus Sulfotelmatobacter sp.]|jgi:hypothetical protein